MKTAAKVFLILSLVSAGIALLCLLFGWDAYVKVIAEAAALEEGITLTPVLFEQVKQTVAPLQIVMIIALIPGTVIAILSLIKISKATAKSELLALGILTLLFTNLIPGILMLCIRDQDLCPPAQNYYQPPVAQPYDIDPYQNDQPKQTNDNNDNNAQ